MFSLCWNIDELKTLAAEGRQLLVDTKVLLDLVTARSDEDIVAANLPRRLCTLKEKLNDFIKRLTRFKRTPATHIFVMISDEFRRIIPYALPVQCLPYAGMNEREIRGLLRSLVCEMVKCGMAVRGKLRDK